MRPIVTIASCPLAFWPLPISIFGGFTTRDIKRCRMMARITALVYNWWSLFVRLADPNQHSEAITSRPLLLHAPARITRHSGWTRITIKSSACRSGLGGKRVPRDRGVLKNAAPNCGIAGLDATAAGRQRQRRRRTRGGPDSTECCTHPASPHSGRTDRPRRIPRSSGHRAPALRPVPAKRHNPAGGRPTTHTQ